MDFEENMVEDFDNEEAEDLLPDDVVEEPEDDSEELDSLDDSADEEEPQEEPKAKEEPGYVRGRIEKAVQKAIAETEARMQAMFEQQMAPLRAKMIEDEAQELVRSRKVADIETARELVQLRQGIAPVQEQPQEQPRNEKGQFAPNDDPATMMRINMLKHQAAQIKEETGIDVIAEWNSNRDVQDAIVNGEIDFYDVARQMQQQQTRKRPPSPVRSPNGASGTNLNAISSMSDEQFARLEKRISEGARYRLK